MSDFKAKICNKFDFHLAPPHTSLGGGLTTVFKELTSKGSIGKEEGRGRGGKGQGKEK